MILAVILGLLLAVGVSALVNWQQLAHPTLDDPARPACSAAENAFAAKLAGDPMLTQAPAGVARRHTSSAEPCVSLDDSSWVGGAVTEWTYTGALSNDDIERFYRALAAQLGWQMRAQGYPPWPCGTTTVDGSGVRFTLELDDRSAGQRTYWAMIDYNGIGAASKGCPSRVLNSPAA